MPAPFPATTQPHRWRAIVTSGKGSGYANYVQFSFSLYRGYAGYLIATLYVLKRQLIIKCYSYCCLSRWRLRKSDWSRETCTRHVMSPKKTDTKNSINRFLCDWERWRCFLKHHHITGGILSLDSGVRTRATVPQDSYVAIYPTVVVVASLCRRRNRKKRSGTEYGFYVIFISSTPSH